jgi:hypothetical protein
MTAPIGSSGTASVYVSANTIAGGPYVVSAASSGTSAAVSFHLTNEPGAAYQLVIHTEPSPSAVVGTAFNPQPVIYIDDQYGNLVTGAGLRGRLSRLSTSGHRPSGSRSVKDAQRTPISRAWYKTSAATNIVGSKQRQSAVSANQ